MSNKWTNAYGAILRTVSKLYNINTKEFGTAIRHWVTGRSFPSEPNHDKVCKVIEKHLVEQLNSYVNKEMIKSLKTILKPLSSDFSTADLQNNDLGKFVVAKLSLCYLNGKNHRHIKRLEPSDKEHKTVKKNISATGKTKAVIFDFDGTLTKGNAARTTWESIWIELGYDVEECRFLHRQFDSRIINHAKWCELTKNKFTERKLNREMVCNIANKIKLLDGCKETFIELHSRNIKIYIVSGSILIIIQNVLKDLYFYIDEVKANDFKFSPDGLLIDIIGTKYDFKGKSRYIDEVAERMKISTKDILFVGNSYNDKYAHLSGVQTLCVNPDRTDPSNHKVWHNCIRDCNNLIDILKFVKD